MDVIDHTESDNENDEFYFESDHIALRGNRDYSLVLRTLTILEAQLIQATRAIDKLATAEREALQNPEEFIKKLISGEDLNLPGPIQVAEVPKIDFEKYNVKFPDQSSLDQINSSKSQDVTVVRGRVFDETKPETFNKLWTCEEQRRLEELLIKYPPEPIEMRRFAKIARALGNRTTKQVASRVQKFFKKLHSAGMPVPGRIPKSRCRFNPNTRNLYRPSTFFPAHDVPVRIPDDDSLFGGVSIADPLQQQQQKIASTATSVSSFDKGNSNIENSGYTVVDEESDDENVNETTKTNTVDDKNRILKLLQRVRRDKEKETVDRPQSNHFHYECNLCKEEPIVGTRWHCCTCTHDSIDYCSDCLVSQILSQNPHPISHKFIGLRVSNTTAQSNTNMFSFGDETENEEDDNDENIKSNYMESNSFYDKDYLPTKFSKNDEYNYLDPNFLP